MFANVRLLWQMQGAGGRSTYQDASKRSPDWFKVDTRLKVHVTILGQLCIYICTCRFTDTCTHTHAHSHISTYTYIHTHYLSNPFPCFADQIVQQKSSLVKFQEDLQRHKDDAQDALTFYRKFLVETKARYAQITSLLSNEQHTEAENVMLCEFQSQFSAFVSADYMMSKNLPFWGESPQPAKTYYQMKRVWCVWPCWSFTRLQLHLLVWWACSWAEDHRSYHFIFSAFHWFTHWYMGQKHHILPWQCKNMQEQIPASLG